MNLFLMYLVVVSLHLEIKGAYLVCRTVTLYTGGLINRVIINLRTAWAYKRDGIYTGGSYIRGFMVYDP